MPRPPTQDLRPLTPALSTVDAPHIPSKSQRKRDAHALQALGVQLVALSAAQLARLDLPETLHEAVVTAQRMRAHGARTRHLQYIGKLMRQLDPGVLSRVRAALEPGRAVTPRPQSSIRQAPAHGHAGTPSHGPSYTSQRADGAGLRPDNGWGYVTSSSPQRNR